MIADERSLMFSWCFIRQGNHKLLPECARKISCDGFELMLYKAWYENIDKIVADIKAMSLNIPIIHCDKELGERISSNEEGALKEAISGFEINFQVAAELKVSRMVIHLWGGIPSDQNIERNISVYKVLNDMAEKYGVTILVENVVCNRKEPMSILLELAQVYPDIVFPFDTKMAAFHDQLDLIYEKEWSWLWEEKYIKHLHINDYNGGYMDWQFRICSPG